MNRARALHVSVNPTPPVRNQTEFGQRTATTGATAGIGSSFIPAGVPNAWMRITRVGDLFSGYHGSNGVDWVLFDTTTQVYPSSMVVGIGVTAHDNALLATGLFSNFHGSGPSVPASPSVHSWRTKILPLPTRDHAASRGRFFS